MKPFLTQSVDVITSNLSYKNGTKSVEKNSATGGATAVQ
jgi:hypothetical protein